MKRFSGSDSVGDLIPICPSEEGKNSKNTHGYSREFQAMLDGLDREDWTEETGFITGKKRRLNLDQVKALEKNFKVENKIEPEQKAKLAEELGLQPRQVAIWFQNRRARWKTKQLEKDYDLLKANYDALKLDFDNLELEKEALNAELRELKEKLWEGKEKSNHSVKEEALFSESENNVSEQSKISPGGLCVESESTNLNHDFCKDASGMEFKLVHEFKDRSSDTDSSGIWKGECNLNNQLLISPAPSSLRFNCFSSSSPSSMDWFHLSEMKAIAARAYQQQHGRVEEQSFFGIEEPCNFFSVDQAPTLHCYIPD
ncbi:hypothetical protein L1049_026133 [Liquidambar formosana]|uniref:Homeobox-leucine zipper protein n=1 Tax=Liquidambar formosana TaxID=63359 RepID=A0AAP0R580_LIQFO